MSLDRLPVTGLQLTIKPSYLLLGIYGVFFTLVVAACVLLQTSLPIKGALMLLVLGMFYLFAKKQLFLNHPRAVRRFSLLNNRVCYIQYNNDTIEQYSVLDESYLSEYLVILLLKRKDTGAKEVLVLMKDSLEENQFRRLKKHLKIHYSG